jgi:hypothetical protein
MRHAYVLPCQKKETGRAGLCLFIEAAQEGPLHEGWGRWVDPGIDDDEPLLIPPNGGSTQLPWRRHDPPPERGFAVYRRA